MLILRTDARSFDCVVVRFANDNSAQDDKVADDRVLADEGVG